ncbi:hypothetical protein G7046_g2470 [Stylonectria norvegica]|nr:hypothetical protein G7046_g2470 [Stylonectria norvegica]
MSLHVPMAHRAKDQGATKAVILVGGPSRGTRFRPLSLDVPKPLFEVAGHPIIWHCLSSVARVPNKQIQEVYIIGYYDESVFRDFIKDSSKEFPDISIKYLREYEALGTAGGLYHFRDAILKGRPERLFVLNADVCCSFPLEEMLRLFKEKDAEAVILGTRVSNEAATNFGCIVSDAHTRRVLHYVEKPESRISNLINCGVYLFSTEAIFPSIKSAMKRRLDRPSRLVSYPSSDNLENSFINNDDDYDVDDEKKEKQVIRLEQDILSDMADSKQFYVYETKDFWRQIKTAGSAVPANALYLQQAAQSGSNELAKPSANIVPPVFIHPTAEVHPTAKLGPNVSIGPRVTVGAGVRIKESVVLEDSEIKHDACVLYSIIGWGSRVGAWARVEGTPLAVGSHSTSIIKNGVKVQSITILGKDCGVGDEVRVQNCVCLPYKELKRDVANEVIMKRHTRCDERHPSCLNCERRAITCDWPLKKSANQSRCSRQILPACGDRDSTVEVDLHRPVSFCTLRGAEVLYFDLFRHEVIQDVAGIGYQEIWTTTMMRESLVNPCLQHLVLALGALSLALEEDGNGGVLPLVNVSKNIAIQKHYKDALRHYGKGLSMLNESVGSDIHPRFIILATIALAGFDLLHGGRTSVGSLLVHGQKLVDTRIARAVEAIDPLPTHAYLDTELERFSDVQALLPRLAMVHSLIPFLPLPQRLEILGSSGFDSESPHKDMDLTTLLRLWREYCTTMSRLGSYIAWVSQEDSQAEMDAAKATMRDKCNVSRAWGDLINHHLELETCPERLRFLNAMKMQHIFISSSMLSEFSTDADDYEASQDLLQHIQTQLLSSSPNLP